MVETNSELTELLVQGVADLGITRHVAGLIVHGVETEFPGLETKAQLKGYLIGEVHERWNAEHEVKLPLGVIEVGLKRCIGRVRQERGANAD